MNSMQFGVYNEENKNSIQKASRSISTTTSGERLLKYIESKLYENIEQGDHGKKSGYLKAFGYTGLGQLTIFPIIFDIVVEKPVRVIINKINSRNRT